MNLIVTGAAGFVGMHLSLRLLADGHRVLGIDKLDDYYDVSLKEARLARLLEFEGFSFAALDVADVARLETLFAAHRPDQVLHFAARPGVRSSHVDPHACIQANLVGFLAVMDACRRHGCKHFVYASSSSVYGDKAEMPLRETDVVDRPVSLYAATKAADELMAHSYSHVFGLPTTGLRLFTVYGPWGRPDMAYFSFTRKIVAGEPIGVFNHGNVQRDFTYVDDVVDAVVGLLAHPPMRETRGIDETSRTGDDATGTAPFRVLNVGTGRPVPVLMLVEALEHSLGRVAVKEFLPMQPGDVVATHADVSALARLLGTRPPVIPLADGIDRFVAWYRDRYGGRYDA